MDENVNIDVATLVNNMKARFAERVAELEYQCSLKDVVIDQLQAELSQARQAVLDLAKKDAANKKSNGKVEIDAPHAH